MTTAASIHRDPITIGIETLGEMFDEMIDTIRAVFTADREIWAHRFRTAEDFFRLIADVIASVRRRVFADAAAPRSGVN